MITRLRHHHVIILGIPSPDNLTFSDSQLLATSVVIEPAAVELSEPSGSLYLTPFFSILPALAPGCFPPDLLICFPQSNARDGGGRETRGKDDADNRHPPPWTAHPDKDIHILHLNTFLIIIITNTPPSLLSSVSSKHRLNP